VGSKNRIVLGFITSQILHQYRDYFSTTKLVVSKKKSKKIQENHPKEAKYIEEFRFQDVLDASVASFFYKEDGIVNFLSYLEGHYLLYGISQNNFYSELTTIFKPSLRQLKKCKENMHFFKKRDEEVFELYIKN
jgi:hypothetical protein